MRREKYLLLIRLCSHMLAPPNFVAGNFNVVVLAYARPTAVLALAPNAVVLAYAAGPVAYEYVRISGECGCVRELCVCLCLCMCLCLCL